MKSTVELPQGTLDVLVLQTLSAGPMHGYGIARWIERVTEDALRLEEGTLYPALYRLEDRKLVKAEWGVTENQRRAKYYRLTAAGRKQLVAETAAWSRLVRVVSSVLAARRPA